MAPQKRKQANVKSILKNPVQSEQSPLKFKKEGILGWLSYLGFSLTIVMTFASTLSQVIKYVSREEMVINFPFYDNWSVMAFLLGFLLTLGVAKESPYQFPKKIIHCYCGALCVYLFSLQYRSLDRLVRGMGGRHYDRSGLYLFYTEHYPFP